MNILFEKPSAEADVWKMNEKSEAFLGLILVLKGICSIHSAESKVPHLFYKEENVSMVQYTSKSY